MNAHLNKLLFWLFISWLTLVYWRPRGFAGRAMHWGYLSPTLWKGQLRFVQNAILSLLMTRTLNCLSKAFNCSLHTIKRLGVLPIALYMTLKLILSAWHTSLHPYSYKDVTALANYFTENATITRFERSTMGLPSEYHIYDITDAWFNT